jgi:hypothetical protein
MEGLLILTGVVTEAAIDVGAVEGFFNNLSENIAVILALVGTVFVFVSRVGSMFANITGSLKDKVDRKDLEGLGSDVQKLAHLFKEIKDLQELSALANIDNKFLDEETKQAYAKVLNDYNTVETLTKDQWKKITDLLTRKEE